MLWLLFLKVESWTCSGDLYCFPFAEMYHVTMVCFLYIILLTQTRSSPRGISEHALVPQLCAKLFLRKAKSFILKSACLRLCVRESASTFLSYHLIFPLGHWKQEPAHDGRSWVSGAAVGRKLPQMKARITVSQCWMCPILLVKRNPPHQYRLPR